MTQEVTTSHTSRLARLGTALLIVGLVLAVGGVVAVLKGNQSARIAAGVDAIRGQQQYGPYMGEWVALLGWVGLAIGVLALIGYAISRYVGRAPRHA